MQKAAVWPIQMLWLLGVLWLSGPALAVPVASAPPPVATGDGRPLTYLRPLVSRGPGCELPHRFLSDLQSQLGSPPSPLPTEFPLESLSTGAESPADCLWLPCLEAARPDRADGWLSLGGVSESVSPAEGTASVCRARLWLVDSRRRQIATIDVWGRQAGWPDTILLAAIALHAAPIYLSPVVTDAVVPRYCQPPASPPPSPPDLQVEYDRLASQPLPPSAACAPYSKPPPAPGRAADGTTAEPQPAMRSPSQKPWQPKVAWPLAGVAGVALLVGGLLVPEQDKPAAPEVACGAGSYAAPGQEPVSVLGWCRQDWRPLFGSLLGVGIASGLVAASVGLHYWYRMSVKGSPASNAAATTTRPLAADSLRSSQ